MVNVYLNLSFFTVVLKNRNFICKIRRSKVTDYAALNILYSINTRDIQNTYIVLFNKSVTVLPRAMQYHRLV